MSFENEPQSIIINAENVYFLNIVAKSSKFFKKKKVFKKPSTTQQHYF